MLLVREEPAAEQPGSVGSRGSVGSTAGSTAGSHSGQPRVVIVDLLHSSCCSDQQVLADEVRELDGLLRGHREEGEGGAEMARGSAAV